jgi:hypothetical protein
VEKGSNEVWSVLKEAQVSGDNTLQSGMAFARSASWRCIQLGTICFAASAI